MPDDVTVDTSELDRAVAQLGEVPRKTLGYVRKAVQVNVMLVKADWREKLAGNEYAPLVPLAITYDTRELAGGIEAEIGAEKGTGKQGGVALLEEYGAPARNLAPRGFGAASLQENLADLEQGVAKALDDGLRAAGW
jgi:hypothetical protein